MKRKLKDFGELWPAEQKLRGEVHTGHAVVISDSVPPEDAPQEVRIRASFLFRIAKGELEDERFCPGVIFVSGALIVQDQTETSWGLPSLENSTVASVLRFERCRFLCRLDFRLLRLPELYLRSSVVHGDVDCDRLQLDGGLFLDKITIYGELRLSGAVVPASLDLSDSVIDPSKHPEGLDRRDKNGQGREAILSVFGTGLKIGGDALFRRANFRNGARLQAAQISGNAVFAGGEFGLEAKPSAKKGTSENRESLNLSALEVKRALIFSGRGFLPAKVCGELNLTNARAAILQQNEFPVVFDRCLRLNGFSYGTIFTTDASANRWLSWLAKEKKSGESFQPQPYEQLAKVYREMGHREDAKTVLIEKERLQRADRRRRLRRNNLFEDTYIASVWDRILGLTIAYGQRPLRAFLWLGLFWLLGLGIFGSAYNAAALKPNDAFSLRSPDWVLCATPEDKQVTLPGGTKPVSGRAEPGQSQFDCFASRQAALGYPTFNPWIYSADTLLPVVNLEMQGYWIPDERMPVGAFARAYLWLHIALGWALSLLAVAGFSGLIKSD